MNISDILEKCNQLEVKDVRVSSLDYDERVIYVKDIDKWESILTEMLGLPVKPAGQKTKQQEFALTVNFGGLFDNQTLYYRKFGDESIIALLWPWKDDVRVTLKIVKFKE